MTNVYDSILPYQHLHIGTTYLLIVCVQKPTEWS